MQTIAISLNRQGNLRGVRVLPVFMMTVLILLAGLASSQSWGQVPQITPGYGQDVETWWASLPYNPEGPNYNPVIPFMSPELNVQTQFASDVQAAIDYVGTNHPDGATLYFPAGTYLAPFDIIGVNNIHFRGDPGGGAIISTNVDQPPDRGWGMTYSYITILSCPEADDYGVYNLCMHDGSCRDCVMHENKVHNIYFKNITFDGNGHNWWGAFYCSSMREVVWDNCTFQNFVSPHEHHPGQINANCRCNNMLVLNSEFAGDNCLATYWDGPHGSGLVSCLNTGSWDSGNHLLLTNDDFSQDTNNNGVWDYEEVRNPQYIIFYNNTVNDNYNAIDINQGGHILIKNNVSSTNVYNFIYSTDRCSNRWSDLEYEGFYNRVIGNVVPSASNSFYELNSRHSCDGDQTNYGKLGNYHVYCNTVGNNPGNGFVYEHGYLFYSTDTDVAGNCVNDPGCTPSNCGDPAVETPVFSPTGGAYGSAQSVTITCGTSGADVYYTTDGSVPTEGTGSSTLYSSPVSISSTLTLRARGFESSLNPSAVKSADYVIDTQAPGPPTGVTLDASTASSVALSWTDATDDNVVVGYRVYRDGGSIGTTTTASYTDSSLTACTGYTYEVTAYDGVPNESVASAALPVTTGPREQDVDLDGDNEVGLSDLAVMAGSWLEVGGPGCPNGDLDVDADVDLADFGLLAADWGMVREEAFLQDTGADGIASMEAEHYDANIAGSSDNWTLVTSPAGASGGEAMQVLPDDGDNLSETQTADSPQLSFTVNFVATGTHYVWVHAYGPDASGDSCHAGLDDSVVSTADKLTLNNTGAWYWTRSTMDASNATIDVPTAGNHTLDLWMREDGLVIDKVVLTTNESYTPSGDGPAESPRN